MQSLAILIINRMNVMGGPLLELGIYTLRKR